METVAFLVTPMRSSESGQNSFGVEVKPWNGTEEGEGVLFDDSDALRRFISQFQGAESFRVFWDSQVDSRQAFTIETTQAEWGHLHDEVVSSRAKWGDA